MIRTRPARRTTLRLQDAPATPLRTLNQNHQNEITREMRVAGEPRVPKARTMRRAGTTKSTMRYTISRPEPSVTFRKLAVACENGPLDRKSPVILNPIESSGLDHLTTESRSGLLKGDRDKTQREEGHADEGGSA